MVNHIRCQYHCNVLKIPVTIIRTPDSERINPLIEQLRVADFFEVVIIDAVMGYSLDSPQPRIIEQELNLYGRVLTQNERACAISHRRAREIIAASEIGGIILEDDARIVDLDRLELLATRFLQEQNSRKSILSLVVYKNENSPTRSDLKDNRTLRLFSEAPLAVGVLLTPEAAQELVVESRTLSFTADWPHSKCRHFVLKRGVVRHGDSTTESVIGATKTRVHKKRLLIRSKSDLRYFQRRILQRIDLARINRRQS